MKTINVWMAIILSSMMFFSCEKNGDSQISSNKIGDSRVGKNKEVTHDNNIEIIYDYNDTNCHIYGDDLEGQLVWNKSVAGKDVLNADIYLGISFLSDIEILETSTNSITWVMDNNKYSFQNITLDKEKMTMQIIDPNDIVVDYTMISKHGVDDFISGMKPGDIISFNNRNTKIFWAPIIFGAACLVSLGVDYYCDNKIQEEAAACTAQRKCSKVLSCGTECVKCGDQQ